MAVEERRILRTDIDKAINNVVRLSRKDKTTHNIIRLYNSLSNKTIDDLDKLSQYLLILLESIYHNNEEIQPYMKELFDIFNDKLIVGGSRDEDEERVVRYRGRKSGLDENALNIIKEMPDEHKMKMFMELMKFEERDRETRLRERELSLEEKKLNYQNMRDLARNLRDLGVPTVLSVILYTGISRMENSFINMMDKFLNHLIIGGVSSVTSIVTKSFDTVAGRTLNYIGSWISDDYNINVAVDEYRKELELKTQDFVEDVLMDTTTGVEGLKIVVSVIMFLFFLVTFTKILRTSHISFLGFSWGFYGGRKKYTKKMKRHKKGKTHKRRKMSHKKKSNKRITKK